MDAGALHSLLSLAQLPRNVAARDLARQALLRCCDDEGARARLEEVAAAAGVDNEGLQAMLAPNSARSAASAQRRGLHRKMHSGAACGRRVGSRPAWVLGMAGQFSNALRCADTVLPCSRPAAEVPSSISGPISRSSSYRSAADGSPSFSAGPASGADAWSRDGSVPPSPLAGPPAAAAAAAAGKAESRPASGRPSANGSSTQQQQQQPAKQQQQPAKQQQQPATQQQQQASKKKQQQSQRQQPPPLPLPPQQQQQPSKQASKSQLHSRPLSELRLPSDDEPAALPLLTPVAALAAPSPPTSGKPSKK